MSTTTWLWKTSATWRTVIVSSASTPRVLASSRLMAYRAAVRCSRCREASAWVRVRTVSPLITKPTVSITRKVSRWRPSLTAKVR